MKRLLRNYLIDSFKNTETILVFDNYILDTIKKTKKHWVRLLVKPKDTDILVLMVYASALTSPSYD